MNGEIVEIVLFLYPWKHDVSFTYKMVTYEFLLNIYMY